MLKVLVNYCGSVQFANPPKLFFEPNPCLWKTGELKGSNDRINLI